MRFVVGELSLRYENFPMMPRGGLLHATSGACAATVASQQLPALAVQCAAGQQLDSSGTAAGQQRDSSGTAAGEHLREREAEGQRDREREREFTGLSREEAVKRWFLVLLEAYPSNIKETTPQILYTLWNFSVRNSNRQLFIQRVHYVPLSHLLPT
jgi:hypothetical protein